MTSASALPTPSDAGLRIRSCRRGMKASAGTSHTRGAPRRRHPHEERRSGHASTAAGSPNSALPLPVPARRLRRAFGPGPLRHAGRGRAVAAAGRGPRRADSRVPRATREPARQMKRDQIILWSPDTPSSGRPRRRSGGSRGRRPTSRFRAGRAGNVGQTRRPRGPAWRLALRDPLRRPGAAHPEPESESRRCPVP
jgi:hypothetical protein